MGRVTFTSPMSNAKVQSPNEILSQNVKNCQKRNNFEIKALVIHLTFACLPQAGILSFVISK
jgi:hypothetical protein